MATDDDSLRARVLIVDDDPDALQASARMLRSLGVQVITADCGDVALRLVATEPIDLLLVDLMMPEKDGVDVAHALRQAHGDPDLPIVIMTGLNDRESRVYALSAADDVVHKPIDWVEAMLRMGHLIEAARSRAALRRELACARRTDATAQPGGAATREITGVVIRLSDPPGRHPRSG
jgi:DNA-binding response OmpR family regulator